jgi:hypothetical protein
MRDIRVLGGIVRGALYVDLVERNRGRALARDIHVRQEIGGAEVARGERVHVVALVTFQHVVLQKRVVLHAAHRDAVIGEDVAVVLGVLRHLLLRRILEPGPQLRERRGHRDLRGDAGVAMRERNVSALARRDGERDSHELRLHRIEARRFRVDACEGRGLELRHPTL